MQNPFPHLILSYQQEVEDEIFVWRQKKSQKIHNEYV